MVRKIVNTKTFKLVPLVAEATAALAGGAQLHTSIAFAQAQLAPNDQCSSSSNQFLRTGDFIAEKTNANQSSGVESAMSAAYNRAHETHLSQNVIIHQNAAAGQSGPVIPMGDLANCGGASSSSSSSSSATQQFTQDVNVFMAPGSNALDFVNDANNGPAVHVGGDAIIQAGAWRNAGARIATAQPDPQLLLQQQQANLAQLQAQKQMQLQMQLQAQQQLQMKIQAGQAAIYQGHARLAEEAKIKAALALQNAQMELQQAAALQMKMASLQQQQQAAASSSSKTKTVVNVNLHGL